MLLGNGAGGFSAATPSPLVDIPIPWPWATSTATENGPRRGRQQQHRGVLLGNGSGGFSALTTFSSGGTNPVSLAVGDFNGDGKPDLAVANYWQ